MRPRSALRPYQVEAAGEAVCDDGRAIFLEVGDGKTVVAETALVDTGAWPALVVAPAQVVATNVWGEEAAQWEHLQHLTVAPIAGSVQRRLRQVFREPPHIETVSYENLLWLTETIDIEKRYTSIVFDELDKMKTPGTKRFRRMRRKVPLLPVRLGLTGSPVGNHLLDLWGEMFMCALDKPLGPRFVDYRDKYFEALDYYQRVWKLKDPVAALPDIRQRISPYVYRRPKGTPSPSPPVRLNPIKVEMPKAVAELSEKLVKELWAKLPSGVELEAIESSALAIKVRQLAGGAVYTDKEGTWEAVHDEKLKALDNLLDELQGEPALIYYWYQHEGTRIHRRLAGRKYASLASNPDALHAWNRGELEALILHPQSSGRGLNLQRGGHHVIWFSLPWSWLMFMQGNGRVARPGQLAPWVTAHELLCGPADARVAAVLQVKAAVEHEILHA